MQTILSKMRELQALENQLNESGQLQGRVKVKEAVPKYKTHRKQKSSFALDSNTSANNPPD